MKKYYREMLITAGLTALTGEIYFYPFDSGFRFTAGVITISFLMLYFHQIPELVLIPFSGVAVVAFRVFLGCFIRYQSFMAAFNLHYPAFFYYLSYAFFLRIGRIKALLRVPVNFVAVMTLADVGANFIELAVRREMGLNYFQDIFTRVLGVGLIRSITTFALYWLIERYRLIIVREEHQKRYEELLELLSELKAELFYIKKSTGDLEYAMKEGYEIYRSLNPGISEDDVVKLKKKALNLAKDIHEIKKDYLRIAAGVNELLPEERREGMRLSAIVSIIKSNTERWMKTAGKSPEFRVQIDKDLIVVNYFSMFSIINNLVSNALDAIDGENGFIEVRVSSDEEYVRLSVFDNGKGIDPRDLPYIFEPGFSTKFAEDGFISTGLGLTHVKNLVEDMGGGISVVSALNRGTKFEVQIPIDGNFLKLTS
ncbi:sensor histidine kinase [Thermoanaerobacterium sp. DL9XJH110]|uniref:sensor histidine kinase n=1 Tax=Thermoanaerobacterium sp. DL9XJH110 TaxID=3386643 RepID=UPI003BB49FBF